MNLLGKLRVSQDRRSPTSSPAASPVGAPRHARVSNALKEFVWLLSDVQQGRLLDLGTAWQSTVSFFTERGFKVYAADMARTWRDFAAEDERRRLAAARNRRGGQVEPANHAELAERFLQSNLEYPPETFHAVLAWDMFDYFHPAVAERVAARLFDLLCLGGVVLAVFHSRLPESFARYRILDAHNIEVLPAPALLTPVRVFQNREILNLFGRFRSSKTFVGRDQIREGLFTK